MAATTPAPLSAEVEHGLRRLKLASIRQVAPEMLVTAKPQRWAPHARSPEQVRRPPLDALITHAGWGLLLATSGDRDLAIDTAGPAGWASASHPRSPAAQNGPRGRPQATRPPVRAT